MTEKTTAECPGCAEREKEAHRLARQLGLNIRDAASDWSYFLLADGTSFTWEPGRYKFEFVDLSAKLNRCPRCDSPKPEWHPAMQHEGEVQPCPDPWHGPKSVNIFDNEPEL